MDAKTGPWWPRTVAFGLAYFGLGLMVSALAGSAASNQARTIWRLAAWGVSGVVYLSHIAYEHFRLRQLPFPIALHAASGAAVGAFGLAVAATIHSFTTAHYRPAYLVALVAWPALIALPALLVALAVAAALARLTRRSQGERDRYL
jgi:hypothetical protein